MKGKMPNAGNKLVIETGPWTNGDAIRDMTDEELAAFMSPFAGCKRCPVGCNRYENNCVDIWLDWLKQGVDNG